MTGEEMERAIQFLIQHHARLSAEIEALKEAFEKAQENALEAQETQAKTAANLDTLTGIVTDLAQNVFRLAEQIEVNQAETRDGFDKLTLSNEVTRDLAQRVASLSIETAQRVSAIEERLR